MNDYNPIPTHPVFCNKLKWTETWPHTNNRETDLPTSLEHAFFKHYDMIRIVLYDSRDTMIAVESVWWLLMDRRLFSTEPSVTIMMNYM